MKNKNIDKGNCVNKTEIKTMQLQGEYYTLNIENVTS
jgi:hypothetical protein